MSTGLFFFLLDKGCVAAIMNVDDVLYKIAVLAFFNITGEFGTVSDKGMVVPLQSACMDENIAVNRV